MACLVAKGVVGTQKHGGGRVRVLSLIKCICFCGHFSKGKARGPLWEHRLNLYFIFSSLLSLYILYIQ